MGSMQSHLQEKHETRAIIAGLKKHCRTKTIVLDGVVLRAAELVKRLEDYVALIDRTASLRGDWSLAVRPERAPSSRRRVTAARRMRTTTSSLAQTSDHRAA